MRAYFRIKLRHEIATALMNMVSVVTFQLFITCRSQCVQISKLVLVLLCVESEKRYAV